MAEPRRLLAGSLATALLALGACSGDAAEDDPPPPEAEGQRLSATFETRRSRLRPGDDVRIGGVTVGQVEDIEETESVIAVSLLIDPEFAPLNEDAKAILRQRTLLGEDFVELSAEAIRP